MGDIGYTFAPGASNAPLGQSAAGGGPQSAVQIKSFTLPNRYVPGQLAPQALLQSLGGGGATAADVLRQLIKAFAPKQSQPGVPTIPSMAPPQGAPQNGAPSQPGAPPDVSAMPPPPHFVPGTGDTPPFSFAPVTPTNPSEAPPFDIGNGSPPGFGNGGTIKQPHIVNPLFNKFGDQAPGLFD